MTVCEVQQRDNEKKLWILYRIFFSEPTDMTAINDFLWFECDYIFDGYEYEDEDEG